MASVLAGALGAAFPAPADPGKLLHRPAPHFVRTTIDGRRIDSASLRGKVVLLSFWATWCTPCLEEMPRFIDWQGRFGPDGLQIVAISLDDEKDDVRGLLGERHVNYPVVMGDVRVRELMEGFSGFQSTF